MTSLTASDGIAIWKLVYYSACLIACIVVTMRHGFAKSSGWIFLLIFTIVRLISASTEIAATFVESDGLQTCAEITSLIGLSPLLLASLGLLSRVYYSILKSPWSILFQLVLLKAIQGPTAVALILSIVGATSVTDIATLGAQPMVKAATILFLVVIIALGLLTAGAAMGRRITHRGEIPIIRAVAISIPLLVVRISYSLAGSFSGLERFNPVIGSLPIQVFMVVVEEMVVVLLYLHAGLSLASAIPEAQDGDTGTESAGRDILYRAGRGDFVGKLGVLSLGVHVAKKMSRRPKDTSEV